MYSNEKKENIPMRKRKIFQFKRKEKIPIRKRKMFQLVKRKYFQYEFGN